MNNYSCSFCIDVFLVSEIWIRKMNGDLQCLAQVSVPVFLRLYGNPGTPVVVTLVIGIPYQKRYLRYQSWQNCFWHCKDIKGGPTYPQVQRAPLSPTLYRALQERSDSHNQFNLRENCPQCRETCNIEKGPRHPGIWRPSLLFATPHSLEYAEKPTNREIMMLIQVLGKVHFLK